MIGAVNESEDVMSSTTETPTIASLQARIRVLEEELNVRNAYIDTLKDINEQLSTKLWELRERALVEQYDAHFAAVPPATKP